MATFSGTIQEFHDFVGPRIRNLIQSKTRAPRLARNGICEQCGQQATLESAHVHGRDRRSIIEEVLIGYREGGLVVLGDLAEVEAKILKAHEPIEETFRFMCGPCHREYDSGDVVAEIRNRPARMEENSVNKVVIGGVELLVTRSGSRTKQYLFDVLPQLLQVLGAAEIGKLQDADFCKKKIGMAYPVLTRDAGQAIDSSGHRRYYPQLVNGEFYVCNDWYQKQFSKWALYLVELSCRF
jgi:hypothetical protein